MSDNAALVWILALLFVFTTYWFGGFDRWLEVILTK